MAESNDEIVIKRSSKREKPKQNPEKSPKEMNFSLYSRIFAVLLMIFSVLLFLSIISYTQKDELNAKITLSELLTIFSSDSMIRIKAETAQNWLGLTGAVLSDLMINGTIGY
ncbi:MAG: DNA translocase FtsK 4TM domain-containing protein, partial [Bacteroidota bacterium]